MNFIQYKTFHLLQIEKLQNRDYAVPDLGDELRWLKCEKGRDTMEGNGGTGQSKQLSSVSLTGTSQSKQLHVFWHFDTDRHTFVNTMMRLKRL